MLRPVKMTWKELCGGVHTGLRHRLPLATVATLPPHSYRHRSLLV